MDCCITVVQQSLTWVGISYSLFAPILRVVKHTIVKALRLLYPVLALDSHILSIKYTIKVFPKRNLRYTGWAEFVTTHSVICVEGVESC